MKQAVVVALCLVACGKSNNSGSSASSGTSGGDHPKWLTAKLVPTTVDAGHGTNVHIDVPEGLPQNTQSVEGPDWKTANDEGPRIHLWRRTKTFKTADEFAADVGAVSKGPTLVEIAKTALPDGRLEYVTALNSNQHLDVTMWIPTDADHGVQASCHWFSSDPNAGTPDPDTIAWLKKVCESVHAGS